MAFKLKNADRLMRKLNALPKEAQQEIKDAVAFSLLSVQNDARRSIQKGPNSGRVYKRGNVTHQASAPGQPPATDSGNLVSHINHEIDKTRGGFSGSVGVHDLGRVPYARRLEFGGRDSRGGNIKARPYLYPAYENNKKKIFNRIRKVLPDSIKRIIRVR